MCAKPIAKIKVLKDNREIKASDHFRIESEKINDTTVNFKAIIVNVQAADAGKYKIEAANKCSTAATQTEFIVKGRLIIHI